MRGIGRNLGRCQSHRSLLRRNLYTPDRRTEFCSAERQIRKRCHRCDCRCHPQSGRRKLLYRSQRRKYEQLQILLGIPACSIRLFSDPLSDHCAKYYEQHFHERVRQNQAIRSHARRRYGKPADHKDDHRRSAHIRCLRQYHRRHLRTAAQLSAL